MAVPSLPAQGSPDWFGWGQGIHNEVTAGRLSDVELRAASVSAVQQAIADGVIEVVPELPTGLVTSTAPTRIIPVQQGTTAPALQDGDLVVTYAQPGSIYYKDFSTDTVDAAPVGLTKLLGTTGMAVKAVTGATGGKALQANSTVSGLTAYAITASMSDPYLAAVETLTRWRHATSHGLSMLFNVDAATDSSYRTSYNITSSTGRARITVRQNGATVTAPESAAGVAPTLPDNTWCLSRSRVENGVIRVKHWVEGDAEPDWQQSLANSAIPTGPAAVGSGGTVSFDVDWFVMATGGKAAVKP